MATETDINIPKGWQQIKLADVAQVKTGATPLKKNAEYYEGGSIPWVTSGLLNELFIDEVAQKITELAVKETNAKVFPKHTLLVAMYGEGQTRGRVSELLIEASTNQACAAIIFEKPSIDLQPFIKYFFLKNYEDIRNLSSGGVQPNLNLGIIKKTELLLPPLNEQHRIVTKIETLTARSRKAREALDAIPALLDQFRQSVLAAAFRGDLTADWREQNPDVEPAEKLLERIREERRERWESDELKKMQIKGKIHKGDKWKERYKKPLDPKAEYLSLICQVPKNWTTSSIDAVTSKLTYGITKRPAYVEAGIPIISAKEIRAGEINLSEAKSISFESFDGLREKCKLAFNDVLFSKTGTIGSVAIVKTQSKLCVSQNVAVLSPLIEPDFLELFLRSKFIQNLAQSQVRTTSIPDLQLGLLSQFPIPFPSLAEQEIIVNRVYKIYDSVKTVSEQVDIGNRYYETLDQSILAKAFRGELVPQDPTDEPATLLLQRIQAEREKLKAKSKSKTKARTKRKKQKP